MRLEVDLEPVAEDSEAKAMYGSNGARWWNEVTLYSLGPLYGTAIAHSLSSTEYLPDMFKANWMLVTMAGMSVGFFCGWGVKLWKKMFSKATGISEDELDKPVDLPDIPGE